MEEDIDEVDEIGEGGSFLNTALAVAKSGFALAGRDNVSRRLDLCRACPQSSTEGETVTCNLCGCNMNIKARFSATRCPLSEAW